MIRAVICLLLCIFLGLGALYLYSVLPPKYDSSTSVISSRVISQADITSYQPYLYIDPMDEERNGKPVEIRYCASDTELLSYYTILYIWEFSDTPWYFQMLGYGDHSWDYEPVIVVINRRSNKISYVYDRGHYRAGITQSRFLEVKKNTHHFAPSENQNGKIFNASHFQKLSPDQFELMNRQIAALPRLPFGKALSLDWACNTPESVIQEMSFSGTKERGFVPVQTNILGGVLAGLAASATIKCIALLIGCLIGIAWRRVIWIGLIGGLAGGITGGISTYIFQSSSLNKSNDIIAVLMAIVIGAALGAIISKIMYKGRMLGYDIIILGIICGITGGLLTSIW